MKFEIKDTCYGYILYEKSIDRMIVIGNIYLYKENNKQLSYCLGRDDWFDYQEIENALCGKTGSYNNGIWEGEHFTPKRILVIQMT